MSEFFIETPKEFNREQFKSIDDIKLFIGQIIIKCQICKKDKPTTEFYHKNKRKFRQFLDFDFISGTIDTRRFLYKFFTKKCKDCKKKLNKEYRQRGNKPH